MQTQKQTTDQLKRLENLFISDIREYLKGGFITDEQKAIHKAKLDQISTVLKSCFDYTEDQVKQLIEQARNI